MNTRRQNGFTLVELVVTMTVSAVVVSFMAMFITGPVSGFADQSRRARLVDSADTSLRRMSRDVRRALPNTVRTRANGSVVALEMLSTVDGGRYRAQPPGTADQVLDFTAADSAFNVIAAFTQIAKPFSSTVHYLAIYNVGVPGADAYELSNVITPPGTQIDVAVDGASGEDRVTLTPAFRFAYGAPTQRVFLVDGPVSYLCDAAGGTLTRYDSYAIAQDHAARDSAVELLAAGASASLMADRVASCSFSYAPGTAERAGLLSLELNVSTQGESINLLSQVHVDNVP
jgi:MSHA biogenesis protein MshO